MKFDSVVILVVIALHSSSAQAQSIFSYGSVAGWNAASSTGSEEWAGTGKKDKSSADKFTESKKKSDDDKSNPETKGNGFQPGERGKGPDFYVPSRGNLFDRDDLDEDEDGKKGQRNHGHSPHWHNALPPDCTPIPEPATYAGLLGMIVFGFAAQRRLAGQFRCVAVTRADTGS